ncbi:Sm-like protein LSM8 [Linum perenne]
MATGGPGLESLVDQTISVITNDGRNIVGVLKGFDQATNIILDESHERVYSTKFLSNQSPLLRIGMLHSYFWFTSMTDSLLCFSQEGVQQLVLGLYIIRGDNISVIGELDEDLDAHLDMSNLRAHPLKPVIH